MRDYVRRSGVGKPGACHIFRHTMATVMLEGGADIRYIQQMLGHADITSTQVYTQVSLRTLTAVHAATHPGASNQPRRHHTATPAVDPASGQHAPGAAGSKDTAEALQQALDAEAEDRAARPPPPRRPERSLSPTEGPHPPRRCCSRRPPGAPRREGCRRRPQQARTNG